MSSGGYRTLRTVWVAITAGGLSSQLQSPGATLLFVTKPYTSLAATSQYVPGVFSQPPGMLATVRGFARKPNAIRGWARVRGKVGDVESFALPPMLSQHSVRKPLSDALAIGMTGIAFAWLRHFIFPALDTVIILQVALLLGLAIFWGTFAAERIDRLVNRVIINDGSSSVQPVEVLHTLPTVSLAKLNEGAPTVPCLISDFHVPFPLSSFDDICSPTYPCPHTKVLMMYSPNAMFSSYDYQRQVVQVGNGLRFADGSIDRPAHVQRPEDFFEAVAHMGRTEPCDIEFLQGSPPFMYFRQDLPQDMQGAVLEKIGLKPHLCASFSVFCSDQGSVTNFHFDSRSGLLQMQSGRKEVIIVHPQHSDYMRPLAGDERRSWMMTESAAVTVPHWSITLHPGDCLYLPPGFWHQVKSLDRYTLGTVVRFKR